MIFVDESIQDKLDYICVGFAYCESSPDELVNAAIVQAGFTPGIHEYKSGYRMENLPARHLLRDSISQIVFEQCQLAVYVAPCSERHMLRNAVLRVAKEITYKNNLSTPQYVFLDEGILGRSDVDETVNVSIDCDSKLVAGIQLADYVAYHCSYLLKCSIEGQSKKITMGKEPHPYSGEDVDLDWLVRTNFRRNFFVEHRAREEIIGDDWTFKCAGFGAFYSENLSPCVKRAANATFDSMYFGCVF